MKRIVLVLVLVAIAVAAAGIYAYINSGNVAGPLTGESVSKNIGGRRPIAVTIDNYTAARPQSGLDTASLVFETPAEGGITRFMAVYLEHDAPDIGPVRSTRLYFNAWAEALGVIFGHDGGNVDALQQLPVLSDIYNEDSNRVSGPFHRISSRPAPQNEYTSTDSLRTYAADHSGVTTGSRMSLPHKDDAPPSQRPASFSLNVQFSYSEYDVAWTYDRSRNLYRRSLGGSPHLEAHSGTQLTAKNVVVMFTSEQPAPDPFTPGAIHMTTEGSGRATVYQDGRAIAGTWQKPSPASTLQWLDSAGHPIPLDRGTTWVEVVPIGNSVTPSP